MKRIFAVLLCVMLLSSAAYAEDAPAAGVTPMVRAGGSFGLAIDAKGVIWGWGDNRDGQLGNGGHSLVRQPVVAAVGISGADVADIRCGNISTLFLLKDGTVWTCGSNNYGQQGIGDKSCARLTEVTQIPSLSDIVQIDCGFGQCLALTADGHVYAWGRNHVGQAGVGTIGSVSAPTLLPLEHVTQIACGGKFCLAMTADGTLYGWGENDQGQLGDACAMGKVVRVPTAMSMPHVLVQIAGGSDASYGLDEDGRVWAWGRNDYWQLGNSGVGKTSAEPVQVQFPEEVRVSRIVAYSSHVGVLTAEGGFWQWGSTFQGQLGIGDRPWRTLPIQASPQNGVADADVGSLQSYVLLDSGLVMSSGFNKYGQLGAFQRQLAHVTTWTSTGLNLLDAAWTDPQN